jgi:hypothetical protein
MSYDQHRPRARYRIKREEFIPCPTGLHRATYRRLLREHARILAQLARLPQRRLYPHVRKRLQTEFANRLRRVRRRLGLRVPLPRARTWYRTGAAAAFIGVSSKTLLRWADAGLVACERSDRGHQQRFFHHRELARVVQGLRL